MSSFQSQSKRVPSRVGAGHGVLRVRLRKNSRSVSLPLVGCFDHVLDRDASARARALHLGEVYSQLLCLLAGGVRGVGPFLPTSSGGILSLLGRALGGVLSLPGGLSCGVLSLLSGLSGGVLRLARRLSRGVLGLLR